MGREPFVWGGAGERLTPKQLEDRRKMAQALMAKGADFSPAGHWTEALGRAFNGWWGGKQAGGFNRQEEEATARAKDTFAGLTGAASANPVAAALAGNSGGTYTAPAEASAIREGLIARGLPEHVADGFIMNFQDESGLNPGINEISPIVPGSRGGFGLYQLTGPRRTAYESFASERGVDPADVDAQLDWLMYELQGPEAKAAQSILSAPDAGSAGAAIVNNFLRPAEQHRNSRAARYMNGASAQAPAGASTQQLYAAMQDPWVAETYGPQLSAMISDAQGRERMAIEQQMKMQDPMYQLGLQKAELELEAMRNPTNEFDQRAQIGQQFGLQGDALTNFALTGEFGSNVKPTGTIQEYEYYANGAMQRGESPMTFEQYQAVIARAGSGSNPLMGSIPAGYRAIQDPLTGQVAGIEPIPGSPAEQEAAAAANKMVAREGIADAASDTVLNAASRALEASKSRSLGVYGQGVLSNLPWTNDAETMRQVNALQSIAASENINAMRQASPTGGALGNASDADIRLLKEKSGALDPASPNFERDLADYTRTLLRTIHGTKAGDEIFEKSWSGSPNTKEGESKSVRKRYNPQTGAFE